MVSAARWVDNAAHLPCWHLIGRLCNGNAHPCNHDCFIVVCHGSSRRFPLQGTADEVFTYYYETGNFTDRVGTPFRVDSPAPLNLVNELYDFQVANFTANDPTFDPHPNPVCESLEFPAHLEAMYEAGSLSLLRAKARFLVDTLRQQRNIDFPEVLLGMPDL